MDNEQTPETKLEIEEQTKAPENQNTAQSAEKEIGVSHDEEGRIHSDFGSALDEVAEKIIGKDHIKSSEQKPAADAGKQDEEKKEESEKSEDDTKPDGEEKQTASLEDAAKGEDVKKTEAKAQSASPTRDDDITAIESKIDPHASPKTRELMDGLKKAAIEARNKLEQAEKQAAELRAEVEARKTAPIPKETEELVKNLTEQIREIDITRDPTFAAKYDKKIQANETTITEALVENGLDPKVAEKVKRAGFSLNTLKPYIEAIEKGEDANGEKFEPNPDLAEQIRDAIRENSKLAKEREVEFNQLKSTYEARQKQIAAAEETKNNQLNERLRTEFKAHVDKFSFTKEPPKILDTDAPAVRKEKEKAISEFNDQITKFSETIRKVSSDPGEQGIAARIGILYRDVITPHLQKQVSTLETQLAEATAQLKKMRKAGSISPTLRAPEALPKKGEPVQGEEFGDAVDAAARAAGILKN